MSAQRLHLSLALAIGLVAVVGMLTLLLGALGDGPPAAQAQSGTGVIRVATTGTDSPGCGSEINPCRTVQYAVDLALPGEEIRVAAGTYTDMHVRDGTTQVVYLSKTVTIRGGYTTADWDHSDPEANRTTLNARRQGRVLYITGDISPTIKGLRITGGDAGGSASDAGGGVYVKTAAAIISDSRVFSNTARWGGGLYLYQSDASLSGNTVTSNTADLYGGGLYLHESDAVLSGNTVICNTVGYGGGGLCLVGSGPTLTNMVVADNQAHAWGSALIIWPGSPRLLHTTLACNSGGDGSGVYVFAGSVALTNTILVGHTTGVYVAKGATARLESTLWGSGDWANGTECTGLGTVYHSNDHTGDPAFVDPDAGDYHIEWASAARDKGVNTGVTSDIDGDPRPIPPGGGFDLGADECTGIDLSSSSKIADLDWVDASKVVTYTITLLNSGPFSAANTLLFDAIPAHTTYISGTAQKTSGDLTDTDGIRWTGTLMPHQPVTINFCVTVNEEMCIKNTAIVTDRYGAVTTLTAYVNHQRMYLPLIMKNYAP